MPIHACISVTSGYTCGFSLVCVCVCGCAMRVIYRHEWNTFVRNFSKIYYNKLRGEGICCAHRLNKQRGKGGTTAHIRISEHTKRLWKHKIFQWLLFSAQIFFVDRHFLFYCLHRPTIFSVTNLFCISDFSCRRLLPFRMGPHCENFGSPLRHRAVCLLLFFTRHFFSPLFKKYWWLRVQRSEQIARFLFI